MAGAQRSPQAASAWSIRSPRPGVRRPSWCTCPARTPGTSSTSARTTRRCARDRRRPAAGGASPRSTRWRPRSARVPARRLTRGAGRRRKVRAQVRELTVRVPVQPPRGLAHRCGDVRDDTSDGGYGFSLTFSTTGTCSWGAPYGSSPRSSGRRGSSGLRRGHGSRARS